MNCLSLLAEQHIRAYESRLKHVDETFSPSAREASPAVRIRWERQVAFMGDSGAGIPAFCGLGPKQSLDHRSLGPMVIWDIVAGRLENVVEKLGG